MSFLSRAANAFRGERLNREIDEELQFHMEEAVASGRDPDEVRHAFGPALRAREASHGIRIAGWLESLFADTRFGWRQLRRNRIASLAAVFSLAIGMGSCVAAFRLMDALLWRPLPIANAQRLYALSRDTIRFDGKPIQDGHWATPEYNLMRDAVRDQADLLAISDADRTDITWSTDAEIEKANVAYVSGNMFPVFGLLPTLGRLFTPNDDRAPGLAPYAVLSWDYWNSRLGQDRAVIGRTLHIGGEVVEIIGVGPRDFTGTEKGVVTDIFLRLGQSGDSTQEGLTWHRVFLLLKPGMQTAGTLGPLRQHLATLNHAYKAGCATCFRNVDPVTMRRLLNEQLVLTYAGAGISEMQQDYRRLLGALGFLALLVLLIACVNVVNVMAAQAIARSHEMALRISIGAGRGRLMQLIVCQSALLAFAASVIGALFAEWSAPFVLSLINPPDDPARLALTADWRVLLFSSGLAVAVVILLGLFPALRASGLRPVGALKGGNGPRSSRRFTRGAIILQVTFCCLVLFLCSLFAASFWRLEHRPLGFSTDRLLLLQTDLNKGGQPATWEQTADAIRAFPGVTSVAISRWPLLGRIAINSDISVDGAPPSPTPAFYLSVSPGWLSTMKIPLLAGRDFRPGDTSPGAAIVNETFAKTFFPGRDPIGRAFQRETGQPAYRIVGVTPDSPYRELREPNRPVFYIPFQEADAPSVPNAVNFATFTIHTDAKNPLVLADPLRRLIAQRHSGLRVSNVTTQYQMFRNQTVRERLIAALAAFFAAAALLLAGVGLYAVLSYSVVQRRREIGIRMAIGSPRTGIVRVVTTDTFLMVALGGCAGIALGMGAARFVASHFYLVRATDTDMLALPCIAILLTTLAAATPAVVRALRTDPASILRAE